MIGLSYRLGEKEGRLTGMGYIPRVARARIIVKALYELHRSGGQYALGHDVHRRRPGHRRDLRKDVRHPGPVLDKSAKTAYYN